MDRKRIAWYSYLALLVGLAGVLVSSLLADPYIKASPMFEAGMLALAILSVLHLWYFRHEFPEMRQGLVERRPWLRYLVKTEPQSLSLLTMALSVGGAILAFVLLTMLTIWIVFIRA